MDLRIQGFGGVVPRLSTSLLKPNQARIAVNCLLTSGELRPLREPLLAFTPSNVTGTILSAYHLHLPATASAAWLVWTVDVDVALSPLSGDKSGRIYYTGDGEPRVTNYALATTGVEPYPAACYVNGVFSPKTAPSIGARSGGVGSDETRVYVYTFVAKTGNIDEESAPSPASAAATGKFDATWPLSALDVAPANSFAVTGASWVGGVATYTVASTFGMRVGEEVTVTGMNPAEYNQVKGKLTGVTSTTLSFAMPSNPGVFVAGGTITRVAPHNTTGMVKRIYRSVTGSNDTKFYFVAEIPVATTTYDDAVAPISLGEELPSTGWLMPPTDLKALVSLPGGVMAGLSGNVVCFSEPYQPHAWPLKYQKPMDYEGVALGHFGTSVVAATNGTPYILNGSDPASMVMQQVEEVWPCTAKRGMVSMGFGCLYPTVEGLALVGVSGVDLATKEFYTVREWTEQLTSSTFSAVRYAGYYIAAYTHEETQQLFLFNRSEPAAVTFASIAPTALHTDLTDDLLYLVVDNKIYKWDKAETRMAQDWMSGDIILPRPINLGAARIDATFDTSTPELVERQATNAATVAANNLVIAARMTKGSLNSSAVNTVALNGSLLDRLIPASADSMTFTLYANDEVVFSTKVETNDVFRLSSGYKSDRLAVRVSGPIEVKSIQLGETPLSLGKV